MSRLPRITPEQAAPAQAELFSVAKAKLGRVPNLMQTLANSPAALRGYLEFAGALGAGEALSATQREIVALAIAEANGCEYCLAAHSAIAKMAGLGPEAIKAARLGDGANDADRALARFAQEVLASRGRVTDEQIDLFHRAGFGNDAIAEVVAHIALNVYTNYFNNVAETEVDFPAAAPLMERHAEGAACSAHCDIA